MFNLCMRVKVSTLSLLFCTTSVSFAQENLMIQSGESKTIIAITSGCTMAKVLRDNKNIQPYQGAYNLTSINIGLESRTSEYWGFSSTFKIGYSIAVDDSFKSAQVKPSTNYQLSANLLFYTPGLPEIKWYAGSNVARQRLAISEYDDYSNGGNIFGFGYQVGIAYQTLPQLEIQAGFEQDFYSDSPVKMRTESIKAGLVFSF